MQAKVNNRTYDIELVEKNGNEVRLRIDGEIIDVDAVLSESGFCSIIHNSQSYNAEITNPSEGKYVITENFRRHEVELHNPRKRYIRGNEADQEDKQDCIKAPMPGKIAAVFVGDGKKVCKDDPLLVIEAMKMQSTYTAREDAYVEHVKVKEGDAVAAGQLLITFQHEDKR